MSRLGLILLMQHYLRVQENLRARPKRWLITGVAGFVGSNILETLLNLDQGYRYR